MLERDSQIRQWRQAAEGFSPELAGIFERAATQRGEELRATAAQVGHAPFPVMPTALDGIAAGDITLGTLSSHLVCKPPRSLLLGLTLIIGPPGSGKTTLLESIAGSAAASNLHTLLLDTKNAASVVLRHPLPMLTPVEGAISLRPPPDETRDAWLHKTLTWIEHACYLHSGSRLIDHAARQVLAHSGTEACLAEVLFQLESESSAKRSFKADNHRESAIVALRRLVHADQGAFHVQRMLDWQRRLACSHGYYLRGMSAEAVRVFALAILFAHLVVGQASPDTSRRLRRLMLLDDARVIVKGTQREGMASVEPIQQLLDLGEAAGLGLVVCIQNLSEVSLNLLSMANNIILVGPVDGAETRFYRERLELTHEQTEYLIHQPKFQAVAALRRHPSFSWAFPLFLPRPDQLLSASDARCIQAQAKERMLAGADVQSWPAPIARPTSVAATPPPATTASEPPSASTTTASPQDTSDAALDPPLHALVLSALSHPCRLQVEHGRACGIAGRELTDLRDQLVGLELLQCHRIGKCVLWEATPKAAELVGRIHQPLHGRGDFPHRWLAHRLAEHLRTQHPRAQVEFAWQGGFLDVYAEGIHGDLHAYEVVMDFDTLERALEKLRAFPGKRVVVCQDQAAAKRVAKASQPLGLFGGYAIEVLTLNDVLAMTRKINS